MKRKEFENNNEGLVCPWCAHKPLIHECPHNPFALMAEKSALQDKVIRLNRQATQYYKLREALREMIS